MKLKRHIDFINENDNLERSMKGLAKFGMSVDLNKIKDRMEVLELTDIKVDWENLEVSGQHNIGDCWASYFYYYDSDEDEWIGGFEEGKPGQNFPIEDRDEMTVDEFFSKLDDWIENFDENTDCVEDDEDEYPEDEDDF